MKISFRGDQTIIPCISFEPETGKDRETLRELVNKLHRENLKFESFSVENKVILLNLPVTHKYE